MIYDLNNLNIGHESVSVGLGYTRVLRLREFIHAGAVMEDEAGVVEGGVGAVEGRRASCPASSTTTTSPVWVSQSSVWLGTVRELLGIGFVSFSLRVGNPPGGLPVEAGWHRRTTPVRVLKVQIVR